jgi:hypothetical protein
MRTPKPVTALSQTVNSLHLDLRASTVRLVIRNVVIVGSLLFGPGQHRSGMPRNVRLAG